MTHDELLYGIKEIERLAEGMWGTKALRAVVEFHTPYNMETGDGEVQGCSCIPELPAFLNPYPCPTIQAIEKELQ